MQIVKNTENLAVSRLVHYSCSASLCAETRLKRRNCSLVLQGDKRRSEAQGSWLGTGLPGSSVPGRIVSLGSTFQNLHKLVFPALKRKDPQVTALREGKT